MGLSEWREHDGVTYLYTSFAMTDASEARAINDLQHELLLAEPAGSLVRILVDLRGSMSSGWDRGELKRSRDMGRVIAAHVRIRAAILGVTGLMAPLIRGTSALGGFTLVPCATEEKAFAYLLRE